MTKLIISIICLTLLTGCTQVPMKLFHCEVRLTDGTKIKCESLTPITDFRRNTSAYDCDGEQIFPIVNVVSIRKVSE